jgi:hypothetical protein
MTRFRTVAYAAGGLLISGAAVVYGLPTPR